jgi:hypothetical protein
MSSLVALSMNVEQSIVEKPLVQMRTVQMSNGFTSKSSDVCYKAPAKPTI